jgi:hypothetical protein
MHLPRPGNSTSKAVGEPSSFPALVQVCYRLWKFQKDTCWISGMRHAHPLMVISPIRRSSRLALILSVDCLEITQCAKHEGDGSIRVRARWFAVVAKADYAGPKH